MSVQVNPEVNRLNETVNTHLKTHAPSYQSVFKNFSTPIDLKGELNLFDSFGGMTRLSEKTDRRGKVPLSESSGYRRGVISRAYESREIYDGFDKMRDYHNFQSPKIMRHVAGARRIWDQVAMNALVGPARIGKFGDQSVNLPSHQIIPHSFQGMTPQKMKQAVTWLRRTNPEARHTYPTAHLTTIQEDDLLQFNENTSHDFDARYNLMGYTLPYKYGALLNIVDDFLDFDQPVVDRDGDGVPDNDGTSAVFDPVLRLRTEIDPNGNPVMIRSVVVQVGDGLAMGEDMPLQTEINSAVPAGHSIGSWQVTTGMSVGGYRTHERKVVIIECVEDPTTNPAAARTFGEL